MRVRLRYGSSIAVLLLVFVATVMVPAAAYAALAHVQGKVVSAVTGAPVSGMTVHQYGPDGSGGWIEQGATSTDSTGAYSFSVTPGAYRFGAGNHVVLGTYYVMQYYPGKTTVGSGTDVVVSSGDVTGVDFSLSSQGPSVVMKLTDSAGNPLPLGSNDVGVSVYSPSSGASALTTGEVLYRDDGVVSYYGLSGSFKLRVEDGAGYYQEQWYKGKADWASASAFTASPAGPADLGTIALVHATPTNAGTLKGVVTDSGTGKPIPFAVVSLNQDPGNKYISSAVTNASGAYSFLVPAGGSYQVSVVSNGYGSSLQAPFTVTTGADTVVNAALDPLGTAGTISGVIRGSTGGVAAPLSGATVLAVDSFTGDVYHTATTGADGAYSFPLEAGNLWDSYKILVSAPLYRGATSGAVLLDVANKAVTVDLTLAKSAAEQVYGPSRYSTSVMIAQQARPGFKDTPHLILASGEDRAAADPLSAAGLSWAYYGSPILLTQTKSVPSEVLAAFKTAVDANPAGITIHVVGGPASVPEARLTQIKSYLGASASKVTFDRLLSTGTRFDMAAAIAARMKVVRGWAMPGVALVANGVDQSKFFDALSLSAVAASKGAPILLVGANSVPAATSSQLSALGVTGANVYVGGGTSTVGSKVFSALGVPSANRIAGSDRYSTSVAIANKGLAMGWLSDQSVGAAAKLPDALAGGAAVGGKGGPLLVTSGSKLSAAPAAWLSAHKAGIKEMLVFGGPNSVSAAVKTSINNALK